MNLAGINRLRDLKTEDLRALARKLGADEITYMTGDAIRLAIIDKIVERELKTQKEGSAS